MCENLYKKVVANLWLIDTAAIVSYE